jgi:molybdenum cofactor guanylyltransferase
VIATRPLISGCILAGGRGERFGGVDKGLVELHGRALVAHVIARLQPQVDELLISANRNIALYGQFGARVVADETVDFSGPLAGMAAALTASSSPWVMVVPCDSPFIPTDLVTRLYATLVEADAVIASVRTGPGRQPVFAMLARHLLPDLARYMNAGGRKIDQWYALHPWAEVDYGEECLDFANINTADELARAEARLAGR